MAICGEECEVAKVTGRATCQQTALANALLPNAAVSEDDYKASFPSRGLYRLLHSMRLETPKKAR